MYVCLIKGNWFVLGQKLVKVVDESTGEYKVQALSTSSDEPHCDVKCVEDVPATNGLFTRVGAW